MNSSYSSRFFQLALAIWFITIAIVLLGRILGPSDLGQNLDQSKTIAFTLDMVNNNQWILPRDSLGELTRKPPMVNWIGAPIVAMGFHNELALKLPALLSGLLITCVTFFSARFLFRKLADSSDPAEAAIGANAIPLAMFASAAWLASPSAIKHIYFMRPDILFTALLVIAWFLSIRLFDTDRPQRVRTLAFGIWALTAAAVLTKGPLAVFIPIYLILHVLVLIPKGSRKEAIKRTHWQWGIPFMLIPPALWFFAAYQINPEHVRDALLGEELGSRVGAGGASGFIEALTRNPGFFVERFVPWSLIAIGAIVIPPSSKIRTHPLAPASLWILVVLGFTTLVSMRAGSYIMPAYPPAAILATYGLYRLFATKSNRYPKRAITLLVLFVLVSASLITLRETTMSRGAKNNTGENLKAFAIHANDYVGHDSVSYAQIGDLPIASLMGRHHNELNTSTTNSVWLIQPITMNPSIEPLIISQSLIGHDPISGEPNDESIALGLYQINEQP
ncbi:MAG: hypothetical protein P1U42_12510 [Phycisphaerales bacterium]|nr:hypothetical protein [Phycisphaerales bacterium]